MLHVVIVCDAFYTNDTAKTYGESWCVAKAFAPGVNRGNKSLLCPNCDQGDWKQ